MTPITPTTVCASFEEPAPRRKNELVPSEAMALLGIKSRSTYREYVDYLERTVEAGGRITMAELDEIRVMKAFCAYGRGTYFSKQNYFKLKVEGKLEAKLKELGLK